MDADDCVINEQTTIKTCFIGKYTTNYRHNDRCYENFSLPSRLYLERDSHLARTHPARTQESRSPFV